MATAKRRAKQNATGKTAAKKSIRGKSSPSETPAKKARTKKAMTKKAGTKKDTGKKTRKKASAKKPAAKKPTTKTAAKKSAKKPTAKKPVAKKPTAKKPVAKKPVAKKPVAKKPTAKKPVAKKKTAKKAAAKKPVAKKPAKRATAKKPAKKSVPKKKAVAKKSASKRKSPAKKQSRSQAAAPPVEAGLFADLSQGERADALRLLLEDPRLSTMANVGRYRVITVEPLAVKPPHGLAGRRLARLVIYDYAADRSVDGCVDLDKNRVTHLNVTRAQPMLAREEEAAAIAIAIADERVKEQLALGEEPQVAMHYWSHHDTNLSFSRRSAAVIFGRPDGNPSLVAVVDLLDDLVCEIVPATQW